MGPPIRVVPVSIADRALSPVVIDIELPLTVISNKYLSTVDYVFCLDKVFTS